MSDEAIQPGQVWQADSAHSESRNIFVVSGVEGRFVVGRLLPVRDGWLYEGRPHRVTAKRVKSHYRLVYRPSPASLDEERQFVRSRPVYELDLGMRVYTLAQNIGASTIGELADHTAEELLAHYNFGEGSLKALRQRLAAVGMYLRGEGK